MDKIDAAVSFTILTHNEEESLKNLLDQLFNSKSISDEIVIVDDFSTDPKTLEILDWAKNQIGCKVYQNKLDNDFSSQKNFAAEHCANAFIFNIDADELKAILGGAWTFDMVDEYANKMDTELGNLYEKSTLPKHPNMTKIKELCVEIVSEYMEENP